MRWLIAHLPLWAYDIRPVHYIVSRWQWREMNKPHGFTREEIDELMRAIDG